MLPTAGVGAAQREFERVKEALQRDGLFDPARKRRLPDLACTVAVVTSLAGAALHDIVTVVKKRWPCCRLLWWTPGFRARARSRRWSRRSDWSTV